MYPPKSDKLKIIDIGRREYCSDEELMHFIPDFPHPLGSEFIFTIRWNNNRFIGNQIEYFVKGLHYIELKYREITGYDFGFGSPSPTFKIIETLKQSDFELAKQLSDWIVDNGGNYYLPKNRL